MVARSMAFLNIRLLVSCLCLSVSVAISNGTRPTFSKVYTVRGAIKLPYAEIVEPFDAFYDAVNGRSRIDYYDGLCKTYHYHGGYDNSSHYGMSHKVVYMTTEDVVNKRTCISVNGTEETPITEQSVIPDLADFAFVKDEMFQTVPCSKWYNEVLRGGKMNKYTFWISEDGAPVHYEMMGYDTLLKSHYDKYEIDYYNYSSDSVDPKVFAIEDNLTCNFLKKLEDIHQHNPIKEFVDNHDDHVHESFERFKAEHNKNYGDLMEHETRKNIFLHNFRYIHSINRAGLWYQLAVNHLADLTDEEFSAMCGRVGTNGFNGGLVFDKQRHIEKGVPDSVDWRLLGAVTPVKDQAICGSCYSFSTTGAIEGAYFIKTGTLVKFSEQSLLDCSWVFINNGCQGGNPSGAFKWIWKHGGLPTDDSYGPYLGVEGRCHADNATRLAAIRGFVNVTYNDADALKAAIAMHGPVSVSLYVGKTFLFYSNGIYSDPKCKTMLHDLNHSVLAVGYGVLDGEPYWLMKNSWSSYWGNDGYFLIRQKGNQCGVLTEPLYPILE